MNLYGLSINRAFLYLLAISGYMGCTGTEIGNPKAVVIDADSIYIQKADMGVRMVGEQEAVTPGGSQLRIVDLDTVSEPVDITVSKDGSFRVDLDGAVDHVYRLRAIYGDERSKPVNVSGVEIEDIDCIEAEPSDLLQFSNVDPDDSVTQTIVLRNVCDDVVTLIEQGFRLRSPVFEMQERSESVQIEPGKEHATDITFSPELPGTYEAMVVFKFDNSDRVTVDILGEAVGENESQKAFVQAISGVCYGEHTDCNVDLRPIVSGYQWPQSASTSELNDMSVELIGLVKEIDCPRPPCYLRGPEIAVSNDGSVSLVAAVFSSLVEPYESWSGLGIWFARFSPEGERLNQELIDFTIPTQTGIVDHSYSIAVNSKGDSYVSHLAQYHAQDGKIDDGELRVYRFDAEGQPRGIPITRYAIRKATVYVDPFDDIVLVTHYTNPDEIARYDPPEPESGEEYSPLTRADISKYSDSGALIFNQVGLNEDAISTEISQIDFDADGKSIVMAVQNTTDSSRTWQAFRLDKNGTILWKRRLPTPEDDWYEDVKIASSPNGDWTMVAGRDDSLTIDRYNALGGATWSWSISTLDPNTVSFMYDTWNSPSSLATDSYNLLNDSKATTLLILNTQWFSSLLYTFPSDGSGFRVSSVTQTWCGGVPQSDGSSLNGGFFSDEAIEAAACGFYSFSLGPEDEIYFSASFVEHPDFNDPEKMVFSLERPSPEEYPNGMEIVITDVVAIGKLLVTAEH